MKNNKYKIVYFYIMSLIENNFIIVIPLNSVFFFHNKIILNLNSNTHTGFLILNVLEMISIFMDQFSISSSMFVLSAQLPAF